MHSIFDDIILYYMVSIGQNRFTVKCRYESLHLFLLKICLSQLKNVHAMNDFDLLIGTDRQTEQTRILRMVKRGSVTIGHYFFFLLFKSAEFVHVTTDETRMQLFLS